MFRFQTHKWWLFWLIVAALAGGGVLAAQYWLRPLQFLAERIEREP